MGVEVVSLMEDGVGLYRRSFRGEAWRYYLASAPFAGLVLWTWQQGSSITLKNDGVAALWLTLAYGVRIVGTGAYSRRLLALQGGGVGQRRTGRRAVADGLGEIWAHAVLVALWFAGLPLLMGTGVFYTAAQYVPFTSSGRGSLRAAVRVALRWWGRQWAVLGLAVLFGGVLLINLGITAALLPELLHALLGVAGVLGRAGTGEFLATSSLFWVSLLLAVYLALDPLMKCAMAVSYHRLQNARGGADLAAEIAGLERAPTGWRRTAGTAMLLGLVALGTTLLSTTGRAQASGRPQVTAPALRRAIRAELQQPAYAWHGDEAAPGAKGASRFLAAIFHPLDRALARAAAAVGRAARWILRRLFGPGTAPHGAGGGGRGPRRAAWVLIGVCLLLAAGLGAAQWRRRRMVTLPARVVARREVDVATASAAEQAEEEWFALAQRLQRGGEARLAFRAAFLGGLAGLGRRRLIDLRRSRTNREYFEELARRAPLLGADGDTAVAARFRAGVRAFDEVWYGGRGVGGEQLEDFLRLQRGLAEAGEANGEA